MSIWWWTPKDGVCHLIRNFGSIKPEYYFKIYFMFAPSPILIWSESVWLTKLKAIKPYKINISKNNKNTITIQSKGLHKRWERAGGRELRSSLKSSTTSSDILCWCPKTVGRARSSNPYGWSEGWEPTLPHGPRCSKGQNLWQRRLFSCTQPKFCNRLTACPFCQHGWGQSIG